MSSHDSSRSASAEPIDVIVVGSGGGALTAAITAASRGLKVRVLEKTPKLGGTTALSGGLLWVPANPLMRRDGVEDSEDAAIRYLESLVAEPEPSVFRERRQAFVRGGPRMVSLLLDRGVRLRRCEGYPDYYPDAPGANVRGRPLEPEVFDAGKLGEWRARIRPQRLIPRRLKLRTSEIRAVALARRNWSGLWTLARVATRSAWAIVSRRQLTVCGEALICQLTYVCLQLGVEIWTEAPVTELWTEDGQVVGVVVEREGASVQMRSRAGVVLAAGGYARNESMRAMYARQPSSVAWTQASEGETGDTLRAAMSIGAAVARMEEAWYSPSSVMPDGKVVPHNPDRTKPHSIIVDASGRRYVNEATNYNRIGQVMYERNRKVDAIPSWLIVDSQHRRRYPFFVAPPGRLPSRWIESGYMKTADTLEGLAASCGVDAGGLRHTVDRFNAMARQGVDEDFGRGGNVYEHHFGDPRNKPNPSLGDLASPPFYAVAIYPGDIGTCGGLVTDGHARVLDEAGEVIAGLYAAGNNAAPIAGGTNWGAGATIGQSMVFGFLAGEHLGERVSAAD